LIESEKFLLVRTDRIGDVILSTPVAVALKQHFPQARIFFLVRSYTKEIVECHPAVDGILVEEEFGNWFKALQRLREENFGTAIFLHPEAKWAVLSWLAGIPQRIGTGFRAYSVFFNRRVFEHRKVSRRHEVEYNLSLLRPLGIEKPEVKFLFTIPLEAEERIEALLANQGVDPNQPLVILHPGSGGSALNWPVQKFAQLADELFYQHKVRVVVTGVHSEKKLIDEFFRLTKAPVLRLDGQLSLKELGALLRRANLLIANSTGPLHLAVAMGTEVIGLYCPIRPCHPDRWGPYGKPTSVVMPPVGECQKCNPSRCPHYNCMDKISVKDVLKMAEINIRGIVT